MKVTVLEVMKRSHSWSKVSVCLVDGCFKFKISSQSKHKTNFTGLEILRNTVIARLLRGTGFLNITLYFSNR
jgi:hypothetical protein